MAKERTEGRGEEEEEGRLLVFFIFLFFLFVFFPLLKLFFDNCVFSYFFLVVFIIFLSVYVYLFCFDSFVVSLHIFSYLSRLFMLLSLCFLVCLSFSFQF